MNKKLRLQMPKGTDEVNYGGDLIRVPPDGIVEVSPEAAEPLLHEGGAVEIMDPVPPSDTPEGMVKIRHITDPNASISIEGIVYTLDEKGEGHIPTHAAAIAESHGFMILV
jgi:hypothetical protein